MSSEIYNSVMEAITNAIDSPGDIPKDPKLLAIKKHAADISTNAELQRAKNQKRKADLDNRKITKSEQQMDKEEAIEKQRSQDSNVVKYPKTEGCGYNILSKILQEAKQDVEEESSDDMEGDDVDEKDNQGGDDEEDSENSETADDEPQEESETFEIAGSTPQSKEEADIALTQAKTRQVQAATGEYVPPNAPQGAEDEEAMGGEYGVEDPVDDDPMKGFGETTDPNSTMGGMYGGMGMDGMGGEDITKTPTAIGRVYMLKKIHVMLSSLEHVLTNCPDRELDDIRVDVNEAFKIFRLIANNLKSFKDTIDDVIVKYYMFIKDTSGKAQGYFKQKNL